MKTIAELLASLQNLAGRITAALSSLPDPNSLEKDSAVAAQARNLEANGQNLSAAVKDLEQIGEQLKGYEEKLKSGDLSEEQLAAARAKLVESGDLLAKSDHEAALETAVTKAKEELKGEYEQREQQREQAAQARTRIADDLKDTVKNPAALSRIPDEHLVGDQAAGNIDKIKERLKKVAEMGITSEAALGDIASMKLDSDDDFEAKTKLWGELAGRSGGGAPPSGKQEFGAAKSTDAPALLI